MKPDQDPRSAAAERVQALARGPKGDKGEPGDRGMSPAQRRAFTYLALVVLVYCALLGFGLFHYVRANAQSRCASVLAEATIPLPHPITGNPSRIWEAHFEQLQAKRARDLGCR